MASTAHVPRQSTLVERVRTALVHVRDVKEKRMFGSVAFLVQAKMCVTARAERIMCRIDPELHDLAVARAGCSTVVMRGRPYRGYVYVAAQNVRTKRALKYWLDLALDYNRRLPEKEKEKRSPRATTPRGRRSRRSS